MIPTDDLIDRLARNLQPVGQNWVAARLLLGLGAGAVGAGAIVGGLGLRPDLLEASGNGAFWTKFAYTLILSVGAFLALERMARPGGAASRRWVVLGLAFAVVGTAAVTQLAVTPREAWAGLVVGTSASQCAWLIALVSMPILAGAIWATRRLAPTRLGPAGLAAGLASGSLGAWIYTFHCPEPGLPFLAIWYSLGILSVGALGALAGRFLLRW